MDRQMNMANRDEASALFAACAKGDLAVMQALLSASADPATLMLTHSDGLNPLMWAACTCNVDSMRLLLDHPSTDAAAMLMTTSRRWGWTPLMWAACTSSMDSMRLLLDHPSADAAEMLMLTDLRGSTVLALTTEHAWQSGCHAPAARPPVCQPTSHAGV
jgi:ankyrin repeat protein